MNASKPRPLIPASVAPLAVLLCVPTLATAERWCSKTTTFRQNCNGAPGCVHTCINATPKPGGGYSFGTYFSLCDNQLLAATNRVDPGFTLGSFTSGELGRDFDEDGEVTVLDYYELREQLRPSAPTGVLVADGSFEEPAVPGNSLEYNPESVAWSFGGNSGLASLPYDFGPAEAVLGTQAAFLQSGNSPEMKGSFSQNVVLPESGRYELSFFDAGGVVGGGLEYDVTLGGQSLLTNSLTTEGQAFSAQWLVFDASAGEYELTFAVTDGQAPGDSIAYFDEVQLRQLVESDPPFLLLGDFNMDGGVDLLDLDILGANFGGPGDETTGDANADGSVDLLDLDILGANFGVTAAAIPEPTTAALTLAAAVGFSRRHRHR